MPDGLCGSDASIMRHYVRERKREHTQLSVCFGCRALDKGQYAPLLLCSGPQEIPRAEGGLRTGLRNMMAKEFYVSVLSSGPMLGALVNKCSAAGFGVVTWSPAKSDVAPYANTAVYVKDTAAEAVLVGDVVFVSLASGNAVHDVLFSQGVAAALKPGAVLVDLSMTDAETSKIHAARLEGRGFKYLRAPFPGVASHITEGEAGIDVIGTDAAFNQAKAALSVIGKPRHRAA